MKALLGKSKVSTALPLLKMVADKYGLNLSRGTDFKMARWIIENTYKINHIK